MDLIKNLKKTWKYTEGQRVYIAIISVISVIYVAIGVVVPLLSAKAIVELTNNQLEQLVYISLVLLGVEFSRDLIHFVRRRCTQRVYRESFIKIQSALGRETLRLTNTTVDSNSSGVFIERLKSDTEQLSIIFNVINRDLMKILSNFGVFVALFVINKIAFVFIAATTLLLFVVENRRTKALQNNNAKYKKKVEKVSGFVGELVRGIRDIKMLNSEESFMQELDKKVTSANVDGYYAKKVNGNYGFLRDSLVDLSDFGLIMLLVYLISLGSLETATALIIYNYSGRVTSLIDNMGTLLETIKDFNLSANRVFEIIDSEEAFPKEKFGDKQIENIDGNFEFKNVRFSYDGGNEVLKGVSFIINSKETVAFVGKSGAGKTTIFNLICKMYDASEGEILIDGININDLNKDSIRGNVTIISQNPYIFNLTIKDNFKLVKADVTDDEIEKACKAACLDDFVESLPEKYETIIGEGGVNLSGGQKQRLAIARALVQDTKIILFDEATSALDNETQNKIKQAIDNLKSDYTILIIAHRLSTIIDADRIMFLNNGIIEAQGNHAELYEKNENYRNLYRAELI